MKLNFDLAVISLSKINFSLSLSLSGGVIISIIIKISNNPNKKITEQKITIPAKEGIHFLKAPNIKTK